MRFGLVTGFIEHLQIVTTSNYTAPANLRILQFTIANAKASQFNFTSRCWVRDPNSALYCCVLKRCRGHVLFSSRYHATDDLSQVHYSGSQVSYPISDIWVCAAKINAEMLSVWMRWAIWHLTHIIRVIIHKLSYWWNFWYFFFWEMFIKSTVHKMFRLIFTSYYTATENIHGRTASLSLQALLCINIITVHSTHINRPMG
jgi:hypothetical protein